MTYVPLLWLWRLWALGIATIALVIGLLPFAAGAIYLHDRFACPAQAAEPEPEGVRLTKPMV